jgi:hypothetical protein
MDAIVAHVEKAVLAVDAGGPGMTRFRLYRGEGALVDAGGQQRVFDCVWSDQATDGPSIGAQAWDYDLIMNIEIAYDATRSAGAQMLSDYDAIRDAIRGSNKAALNALGFGFFRFDSGPTKQTSGADDNVTFAIIPVTCRVTVEH